MNNRPIPRTAARPSYMYRNMSTASGKTKKPALMRYYELRDLIDSSNSLPDLETVEQEMKIAELEYGDDIWSPYAANLAFLFFGRTRVIVGNLLKS